MFTWNSALISYEASAWVNCYGHLGIHLHDWELESDGLILVELCELFLNDNDIFSFNILWHCNNKLWCCHNLKDCLVHQFSSVFFLFNNRSNISVRTSQYIFIMIFLLWFIINGIQATDRIWMSKHLHACQNLTCTETPNFNVKNWHGT